MYACPNRGAGFFLLARRLARFMRSPQERQLRPYAKEDPATGAAAAALGGYLREHELVTPPCTVTIHQGVDMGRPSVITVDIAPGPGEGIAVSGAAVALDTTS